jgi:hypothetical protein
MYIIFCRVELTGDISAGFEYVSWYLDERILFAVHRMWSNIGIKIQIFIYNNKNAATVLGIIESSKLGLTSSAICSKSTSRNLFVIIKSVFLKKIVRQ